MRRSTWTEERRADLSRMWGENRSADDIAAALGTSRGGVYVQANKLGLARRSERGPVRKMKIGPRDETGHRRFTKHAHEYDGARIVVAPYHPASREGATIFGRMVKPAAQMVQILKSGAHSRKLGGGVAKGRWKGMPIFMLTLEERETCPRTCQQWASCFGNNMHMAQRISDDGTLERRLWGELASLNARHPAGFVVRLHILGDFYSLGYVAFWRQALADFPALRIFGFTARLPDTEIGAAIVDMANSPPERVAMRFSGWRTAHNAAEVVDRPEDATGILCPAQTDPDRCCATCALCWQTDRTISFVRH